MFMVGGPRSTREREPEPQRGGDSSHLSIGEVLGILREEFPDVTISKIRFLESQGLIDPERTPSGYRKFYEADVSRLRWILHQQKEHFLPLKVIKERLDRMGEEQPAPVHAIARAETPRTPRSVRQTRRAAQDLAPQLPLGDPMPAPPDNDELAPSARNGDRAGTDDHTPPRQQEGRAQAAARETRAERRRARRAATSAPAARGPSEAAARRQQGRPHPQGARAVRRARRLAAERARVVRPARARGVRRPDGLFDDEDLAIASAAAGFYAHGIRPVTSACTSTSPTARRRCSSRCCSRTAAAQPASPREGAAGVHVAGPARSALRAALLVHAMRDSLGE